MGKTLAAILLSFAGAAAVACSMPSSVTPAQRQPLGLLRNPDGSYSVSVQSGGGSQLKWVDRLTVYPPSSFPTLPESRRISADYWPAFDEPPYQTVGSCDGKAEAVTRAAGNGLEAEAVNDPVLVAALARRFRAMVRESGIQPDCSYDSTKPDFPRI